MQNNNQAQFVLTYGTLRAPENCPAELRKHKVYNHDRFGRGTQKYIKTLRIPGFQLFDLGPFPAICEGEGEITVELHEVTTDAFRNIEYMEQGAGYDSKVIQVDIEGGTVEAKIYYMNKQDLPPRILKNERIESGDWCVA